MQEERINHPSYYKSRNNVEAIDVIRHYTCDIANVMKYLLRAGEKKETGMTDIDKEIEDLKKSAWYINDYMNEFMIEPRIYIPTAIVHPCGYSVSEVTKGYNNKIACIIDCLWYVGLVIDGHVVKTFDEVDKLRKAKSLIVSRIEELKANKNIRENDK